jgi:hypothetical protein
MQFLSFMCHQLIAISYQILLGTAIIIPGSGAIADMEDDTV